MYFTEYNASPTTLFVIEHEVFFLHVLLLLFALCKTMPTKHSPRRSPRLDASGVPAAATTTAKTTRNLTSSADVAGDHDCASGGHNGKDRTVRDGAGATFKKPTVILHRWSHAAER